MAGKRLRFQVAGGDAGEAVTNAARPGPAPRVHITIARSRDVLSISIADDGRGFDPSSARRGNGLANLRKRAAALGADLDVASAPGHGTRVTLSVPFRHPA